jgi:hypothetical protein
MFVERSTLTFPCRAKDFFQQDLGFPAQQAFEIAAAESVAQFGQFGASASDYRWGDSVGKLGRRGPRSRTKRENMQFAKPDLFHSPACGLEILFRFARKADQHIRRESRVI